MGSWVDNRQRRVRDTVLLDVVPHDVVTQARSGRHGDEAVRVHGVAGRLEIPRCGVVVDTRGEQASLVVLADVLAGGTEDLEVAEAAHVRFAPHPECLGDRSRLHGAGDASSQHIDPADVRGSARNPIGPGEQAALGDLG